MIGYTVRGVNAEGQEATYPAPDDVLRNTAEPDWPIVTDQAEAVTEARSALIESEGWQVALVYRIEDDETEVLVAALAPEPYLGAVRPVS